MIEAKKLGDVKLSVYAVVCDHCTEEQIITLGNREEVVGARCENCHSVLWLNGRKHSVLGEDFKQMPEGSDYPAWRRSKHRLFFASLPECPVCGQMFTAFSKLISNVPEGPIVCRACEGVVSTTRCGACQRL